MWKRGEAIQAGREPGREKTTYRDARIERTTDDESLALRVLDGTFDARERKVQAELNRRSLFELLFHLNRVSCLAKIELVAGLRVDASGRRVPVVLVDHRGADVAVRNRLDRGPAVGAHVGIHAVADRMHMNLHGLRKDRGSEGLKS